VPFAYRPGKSKNEDLSPAAQAFAEFVLKEAARVAKVGEAAL
jgi:hypothetical protein